MDQRLIKDHMPLAERIARSFGRPSCDCDDLISEAYLALVESARRYNPDRGAKFSTYAYRRIRGRCINWLASHELESHDADPDDCADTSIDIADLIGGLTGVERRVIVALYLDGRRASDVAADLGCSVRTVGAIRRRAIERIRRGD